MCMWGGGKNLSSLTLITLSNIEPIFISISTLLFAGAFKADLFRYCVLLIRGGVYADMDVLLQTNLDDAIANDIGFMTPIDQVSR